ncbi:MAG TPA: pyridoxine 5'-phosphate synthase [Candidatus Marinimicrobia bacterium]|nr:pyridoxine 5'-phosphate synthase [Candidatus Neomarinimicrobiota bacterium]HRS52356.1 pyridoxine 5'-phosphate synthase [Candidatus Neomarinimicrobiota bacterium]HRU92995.1 pyridoxine 5'-phosphate synthase [Candidatus Neomarinimicrobiota bacterium]
MRYLEINLDPFLTLGQIVDTPLCNPLNLLSFIEAVGVAGISFTNLPEREGLINIAAMRTMSRCRLNIRTNIENQALQRAMSVNPDFITLINLDESDLTVDPHSQIVHNLVETVQSAEDFNLILRLKPEIRDLKAAYRLKVDEVELATDSLAAQELQTSYLAELNKIVLASRLASHNHMRISLGGRLHKRLILTLLELIDVEFISVGRALLGQALITGLDMALRELLEIVNR